MESINFCVPSDRSVIMDWSENPETYAAYQKMMRIYHATAPLRAVSPNIFYTEGMNEQVACIAYDSEAGKLLVLVNIMPEERTITLPCEKLMGKAKNLVSGEKETLDQEVTLGAYEYKILQY